MGICYKCLQYGHIASNCKVDIGKVNASTSNRGEASDERYAVRARTQRRACLPAVPLAVLAFFLEY